MSIGIFDILRILGSLAFFIYGMKVMSEGIQKAAGSQLRTIMRRVTRNRYVGLLSGFLLTLLVQSSSATTVMTVSFVNAGLISLIESAGLMMGANIGTTITGWLISMGIGKFSFADYSLPIIALGLPLLFIKDGKRRFWGEAVIGFALLFLGLDFLQKSVPDFNEFPEALRFLTNYSQLGFVSSLLFVLIGGIITAAVQSSSAAMALTLVMLSKGWIPMEVAAAMILGENIGTTITAEIASLVGNVHAKRSARIHSLFNIIGVTWMILLLPWLLPMIREFTETSIVPYFKFSSSDVTTIAAFHTFFNLTNAVLLIGFAPWLAKVATKTVSVKGAKDENFRLAFIDSLLKTPELSIIEVQKQVARFGEITSRMSGFTKQLLLATEINAQNELLERIRKYEDITDRIELELSNYLDKISTDEVSLQTSVRIRNILAICTNLEQIGDAFFQMSKVIERKREEKIWFNQHQRDQMIKMFGLVDTAFKILDENLSSPKYSYVTLEKAKEAEHHINTFRDQLREEIDLSRDKKDYNINSTLIYNNLFSLLEKIGDHIMHCSEAIVNQP